MRSFWRNNALYTLADGALEKDEDGSQFSRWTLAKWQDDKWHFVGDYKTYTMEILKLIPCDNDRFIVISCYNDLSNDTSLNRTPFHRMSAPAGKTELKLGAPLDHGMDELRKHMAEPACFELALLSHIVMTENHATLINFNTGLYWVFSLEKASLVKAGNIFKKVTPEMTAKGGFPNAILRVNPEKDGTVLVASLEEFFFMTETGDASKEINEMIFMSEEDRGKIFKRRRKELADRNPFIIWYRIYPENGKVERLDQPPEGGASLRDGGENDFWRPMPDGSVKMGDIEMTLIQKSKRMKKISNMKEPALK
jgi:hypothetical protein